MRQSRWLHRRAARSDALRRVLCAGPAHRLGSRRGGVQGGRGSAVEAFDAILRGDFDVEERDEGRVVPANVDSIWWTRGLTVRVGNRGRKVKRRRYVLPIGDIEFEE